MSQCNQVTMFSITNIIPNNCHYGLAEPAISAGVISATTNAKQLHINRVIRVWGLRSVYSINAAWKIFIRIEAAQSDHRLVRLYTGTLLINRTPFKIANKVGRQ